MKKIKIITVSLLMASALMAAGVSADYDISVRMDSISSDITEYVDFGDVKPVQLESRTLTPARAMGEAASMIVTWDQPTQTAILTLDANAYSDKPIERYAAKLFDMVSDKAIRGLTPVDITAALTLDKSTAVIRFNYLDEEGDYVAMGYEYEMVSKAILVDNGTLMIPVRDSMEMFGLNVGWNQDQLCAYVSIPETPYVPDSINIIANHGEGIYAPTEENSQEYTCYSYEDLLNGGDGLSYAAANVTEDGYELEYIGNFKITHYCPCEICNGPWGPYTAWAGDIIPGQTVGVNPSIISPLSWIYIDGYGLRRAEDTGSGIGTYHIDVAVPTHDMIKDLSVVYRDVYIVKNHE